MHFRAPQQNEPRPPTDAPPLAWGCATLFASAFIIVGVLPWLALLGFFPRNEYFGDARDIVLLSSLAFLVVGLFLLTNILRALFGRPHLSGRLFADLIAFALAIPFHWWLFFGKLEGESTTGINLPGGITLFTNLPINDILAKIVVALICLVLDLLLISEVFGLGWFVWTSENKNNE